MPNADLICEVRTESGVYRDWLTVEVSQSVDNRWQRSFALTAAEPSPDLMRRLVPGTRVDIALAGQPVITQGYIGTRQTAFDANRHAVQFRGYSKADILMKASANGGSGQFRGYKIDAIANALLKPYGLKFRVENGPKGWDMPFPNVVLHHGETGFDAIGRLCRQRGLWFWADPSGNLVAGAGPHAAAGILFEEGINILSASCTMNWEAVESVVARSQLPGSDNLFGRGAAEVSAESKLPDGMPGTKRIVLGEMPLSQKELQLRTNMEAQALQASMVRVTLSYQGWLNPAGELWALSDFVTVKSPMLFPIEAKQLDMKLWGYTYSQTPEGQTTTAIELVNLPAFQQRYQDGTTSDGFFNQPTEAQPSSA